MIARSRGRRVVLGDAVRDHLRLRVFCETCSHNKLINPADLAKRVGYDFSLPSLKHRMKCSKCGSREVDLRVESENPGVITRHGPAV